MLLLTQELGSAQREATRHPGLVDPFGRAITYLRVWVTDRCDLRCVYCMSEHMTFLPKRDLLTLHELDRVCSAFVAQRRAQAADHRRRTAGQARRDGAVPFARRATWGRAPSTSSP